MIRDPATARAHLMLTSEINLGECSKLAMVKAVQHVVSSHEALRTTIETDSTGRPWQVIHDPSSLHIELIDFDEENAGVTIAQQPLDLSTQLPIRVALQRKPSGGSRLILVVHHIAVDGTALDLVSQHISSAALSYDGHANHRCNPDQWSPRDQADFETSPQGQAMNARAQGHWISAGDEMPRDFPPERLVQDALGWSSIQIKSARLSKICAQARRTNKCLPSAVLLAAFAISIARQKGRDSTLFATTQSNRSESRLRSYIGTLIEQAWIVVRTTPEITVRQLLQNTSRSIMESIHFGIYDPGPVYLASVARGVNQANDGAIGWNYLKRKCDCTTATPETEETMIQPWRTQRKQKNGVFVVDHGSHMIISIQVSGSIYSDEDLATLAANLPTVIEQFDTLSEQPLEALEHPFKTRVLDSRWADREGAWIYLPDLEKVVSHFPGVSTAKIFFQANDDETRNLLICCIEATVAFVMPELREHIGRSIGDRVWYAMPDKFNVYASTPESPSDFSSWDSLPITAEYGAGTHGSHSRRAEHIVRQAATSTGIPALPSGPLTLSYAESGAEYVMMPAFTEAIHHSGATAVNIFDFMTPAGMETIIESGLVREHAGLIGD
ncbi:condensation domain-containing protein [Arthrobacter sp. R1-13]